MIYNLCLFLFFQLNPQFSDRAGWLLSKMTELEKAVDLDKLVKLILVDKTMTIQY